MRVEDYGKVAATFVDTHTGRAIRIAPRPAIRQYARAYAPEARNKWEAIDSVAQGSTLTFCAVEEACRLPDRPDSA